MGEGHRGSKRFDARHVVVTGAGTGIGRAIALRLAEEGAVVSLLARDARRLDGVAQEIRSGGGRAQAFACDVRVRAAVDAAFDSARESAGPLFALVANAGIGGANAPGAGDRFGDLVATNLNGTYDCARAAQRHLAPGPEPRHMVVMASILARIGVAGYTGYCASKAGLLGLVRALAMELAPQNVQVNAICPGWVETDMALTGLQGMASAMNVTPDEARRIAMSAVPLGRMSQPAEIAGVVAWLISPDARGTTGQGIDVTHGAFMI
jgi:NAD(P)-dependent dehydrogenase (short-subunit alcohol dehydrogenase family)